MNNKCATKDTGIKSEPIDYDIFSNQDKDNTEMVEIQYLKVKNKGDTNENMYTKNNISHQTVKIKKENANFDSINNCNQAFNTDQSSVNTFEFVNIKVEQKDDFNTEESSLDNNLDPVATNDG